MNIRHKQYQRKRSPVGRFFHSWWLGVAIVLAFIAGIALYQKISSHVAKNAKEPLAFGVALGDQLYDADYTKRMAVLGRIQKAGFTEVRLSLEWDKTEPTKGKIDWKHIDNLMKVVKKTGLQTVFLANSTPTWARSDLCKNSPACPPENPADYANFMAAAAERYKNQDVVAWEVWNEQNGNNFWKPQPNVEQYAQLLKVTYPAIKKANPSATVLIGGLSGDSVDTIGPNLIDPRTYLKKLYTAGVKDYFDGLAYHPYLGVGLPTKKGDYNGWAKMNTGANNLRSTMVAHGDSDKDIWITEFGIPTGGSGPVVTDPSNVPAKADHVTLEAQAEIVQAIVISLEKSPWVRNFDWYTYKDDSLAKTFTGAAYGIWQLDDEPKPMLQILQNAMQKAKEDSFKESAK